MTTCETESTIAASERTFAHLWALSGAPGNEHGTPAGAFDQRFGGVSVGLLVGEVVDGDVGALAGKRDGDGAAYARVTARDQRAHAGQTVVANVAVLTVVRWRIHAARQTRRLLLLRREAASIVLTDHGLGALRDLRLVRHVDPLRDTCLPQFPSTERPNRRNRSQPVSHRRTSGQRRVARRRITLSTRIRGEAIAGFGAAGVGS
jgi:hypothetical protein